MTYGVGCLTITPRGLGLTCGDQDGMNDTLIILQLLLGLPVLYASGSAGTLVISSAAYSA